MGQISIVINMGLDLPESEFSKAGRLAKSQVSFLGTYLVLTHHSLRPPFLRIIYKHLSTVRSMADKYLLDYAAHQTGRLYNRGECIE